VRPRIDFARRMAWKLLRREQVDYPDATAGESWWQDGEPHIAVSRSLPPGRLRFTLAHEWGHLVMGHHRHPVRDLGPGVRLRDAEEAPLEAPDPMEVEANAFAAELLMPLRLFAADWRRRPDVRWLAVRYEVSEAAVRWRSLQVMETP
jgi:Zn-dependent peptidase ImmA (M78 family)